MRNVIYQFWCQARIVPQMLRLQENQHAAVTCTPKRMKAGFAVHRRKRQGDNAKFGYKRTISDNNRSQIPESNESLEPIPR
jgi:hypothetical protein